MLMKMQKKFLGAIHHQTFGLHEEIFDLMDTRANLWARERTLLSSDAGV